MITYWKVFRNVLAIMCENKALFSMLLTAAALHLNTHIHVNVSIIRVQCRHLPFMYLLLLVAVMCAVKNKNYHGKLYKNTEIGGKSLN